MVAALGLLLKGHSVAVIEKNPDFAREFRGEVLQPRFWRAIESTGLMKIIKSFEHEEFDKIHFYSGEKMTTSIDVARVSRRFPFVTWMTQPILLEGLLRECQKFKNFKMFFNTKVKQLVRESAKVCGIQFEAGDLDQIINSKVTVGADGRFSKMRALGGFELRRQEHHFDVIWFETERPKDFPNSLLFFIDAPYPCLVLPKFPNKIQAGFLIRPKKAKEILQQGSEHLVLCLEKTHSLFKGVARDLINRKHFTVLSGVVEELDSWAIDGMLMIGDAAHTCSPAGAIGVTIATETAVCAIDVVDAALKSNDCSARFLSQVQTSRLPAVRVIHSMQRRAALAVNSPRWIRRMLVLGLKIANKTGLANRIVRRIIT